MHTDRQAGASPDGGARRAVPAGAPPAGPRLGRRGALSLAGLGLVSAALAACGKGEEAVVVPERVDTKELEPKEGKERLVAGNERYVTGMPAHPDQSMTRRKKLGQGQTPFAAVLSCADSRVPPEIVFDQGLGDLFVVRSAGQVLDRAVLGSLQFGVGELGVALLVVLGHTKCGAVKATVEAIEKKAAPSGTDIDALVAAISPSVAEAEEAGIEASDLVGAAIEFNVEAVVEQLGQAKVLRTAEKKRKLKVLGAVYDVDTGEVDFL
jgi:carbonic anhydrase